MSRRLVPIALVALLASAGAAASAHAETTTIQIPGRYFDPARSTLVAGDVVVFRNNDFDTHDVRIGAGAFDSGAIPPLHSWSQQINQPGGYPFICTLHAFMSGNIDVLAATLAAAPDSVLAGEPVTLSGRATAGTARVGLEQSVSGGPWTALGAGVAPAQDGTFETIVPAVEGAGYRVTTPAGASRPVAPRVQAGVVVHATVKRKRRHTSVRIHTMPATTGFTARLELYSRWHFRWRRQQQERLDPHGRAAFRLPTSRRTLARVVLSRRQGAPALASSAVVSLRSGRLARDPETILPHGGGHGARGDGSAHDGHG